jgi:hypothetical protein
MSRAAAPAAVLGLAAAATAYVAAVDPNEPGHYPGCPFLALTGWYCPGCGSLRTVHALAHGDVAAAFGLNPLTVLALPLLAATWLLWTRRRLAGRERTRVAPAWTLHLLLVAMLLFWFLRNLPAFTWLAP